MFKNSIKHGVKDKAILPNITQLENNLEKSKLTANLAELECGETAMIIKIQGNNALIGRLEAMGILPGMIIIKKSAILSKGPIIVEKGKTQYALGYNIAHKILVRSVKQED